MNAPAASQGRPWWQPILSHQHGPLVALLVSFVLGAAGAQQWSGSTSLALIAVLAAFQAEHPLVQQIRRRRQLQPHLLLWAGIYGLIALGLGGTLAWQTPSLFVIGAAVALAVGVDALAVLQRRQRELSHELLAFAAVCMAAPFAWVSTTGQLEPAALCLWAICSLYFGSSVVLLKLRRDSAASLTPALLCGALATALVALGWWLGLLPPLEALAYGVALLKGAWVMSRLERYRAAPIGQVAALKSGSALLFLLVAALALLPRTLQG